ncbi:MAG TPA: hypothetical protein VM866_09225 [Pyrinomonadaceae bacterium]|nr:hypothetical protein [Pyrinomonadaceae bacterium]
MSRRRRNTHRPALIASFALALTLSAQVQARRDSQRQAAEQGSAQGGRLRPPDSIKCPDNNVTSFTGRILAYSRTDGRIIIRMRTDEATTERFTFRVSDSESAAKGFLLRGDPFKESDWKLVELKKGRLRPKMRATVWVCDDGSTPVVDWRPGEANSSSVY